jgi:hypothetical protein
MPLGANESLEGAHMTMVTKYVALLVGLVILIPLDLVVALGMSFTGSSQLKIDDALFVLIACLVDVPAVAISFVRLRLGALTILSSAVLSLTMAAAFFIVHGDLPTGKVAGQALAFWGLKFLVGAGLLYAHGRSSAITV